MPQDDIMQGHETRLTLLEEQTRDIRATLKDLANDMRRIADATIQQAEDRQALKRAFDQIDKLSARFDDLESRLDESEKARLKLAASKAEHELAQSNADKKRFLWMVASYAIAAGFGAVLAHFGIVAIK